MLGAVDDRIPSSRSAQQRVQSPRDEWKPAIDGRIAALEHKIDEVTGDDCTGVYSEVVRGVASTALTALSQQVDLVVIGSPHQRGTAERLSLGGAGKALVQSCQAPLLIVPAPAAT